MACPKSGSSDTTGGLKCAPCGSKEALGLKVYSALELEKELSCLPLWVSSESGDAIVRSFVATNFVTAMAFLNEVAKVAEEQGHHPDLHLTQYRNVEIRLQTHKMRGVTQNDIAEAGLFDLLPVNYSPKWLREHPEAATAAAASAPITSSPSPAALNA